MSSYTAGARSSCQNHSRAMANGGTRLLPFVKRLDGKVALITGAASGIGEAAARLFSRHGAKVVIADVQDDKGSAVASDLGGPAATFVHCDVTREDDVRRAVDSAVSVYGRLDIMYGNAGVSNAAGPFENTDVDEFRRTIDVNVTGAFLGAKHAARAMVPRRSGSMVFTASSASVMGGLGTCAYTCSKHAVVGLVRSAAAELGQYGIRVNCVSPHAVATPLAMEFMGCGADAVERRTEASNVLKGVFLKARDIAEAALFLASDDGSCVTGHNLAVDGGYTVTNPTLPADLKGRLKDY